MTKTLAPHPLSEIFPLMEGPDLENLAADIKENGQREAILLLDGKVLDGRNRYRACLWAGVAPVCEEWQGTNPLAFVVSKNLHRRHLSTSQRAMIAAKLAKQYDPAENLPGKSKTSPQGGILDNGPTQSQAADMMNVSRSLASDAKQVILAGNDEITRAVSEGEMTVSKARARLAPNKQQAERQKRNKCNPDKMRHETRLRNAARYAQLRDGIQALSGLPDIETMMKTIPPAGREIIARALPHAVDWINEFYTEWKRTHEPSH